MSGLLKRDQGPKRDTPRMPERRQHDPHPNFPKSVPPIETREEYEALLAGLPDMERGLELLPRKSPLRIPLARAVSSFRQRVREWERDHGGSCNS